MLSDLGEWERRMRLKEFFYGRDSKDQFEEIEPWKKKKSYFTPDTGRDKWLDMYLEVVKNDIMDSIKKRVENNITVEEQKAMRDLLYDDDIVIRPADKGSGVVIVNKDDYVRNLEKEMEQRITLIKHKRR